MNYWIFMKERGVMYPVLLGKTMKREEVSKKLSEYRRILSDPNEYDAFFLWSGTRIHACFQAFNCRAADLEYPFLMLDRDNDLVLVKDYNYFLMIERGM